MQAWAPLFPNLTQVHCSLAKALLVCEKRTQDACSTVTEQSEQNGLVDSSTHVLPSGLQSPGLVHKSSLCSLYTQVQFQHSASAFSSRTSLCTQYHAGSYMYYYTY